MNEQDQLVTFSRLRDGHISQAAAAKILRFSVRWVRKKFKRFIEFGAPGLVHQRRNKPSSKTWDKDQRSFVMKLFDGQFNGFGPTFAAENIRINRETLRQSLITHGHWHGQTHKPKHRKWRERKEYFDILIQLDGSPHDHFDGSQSISIRNIKLHCTEISQSPIRLQKPIFKQHVIHKPAANHPWRLYNSVTKSQHPNGGLPGEVSHFVKTSQDRLAKTG